jgi:hypothetical protein
MGRGLHAKTLDLIAACYDILEEEQPLTVRGVCYRLFNRKLIDDMSVKSTKIVSRILTIARERELVPWEWIVDETREIAGWATWSDPARFLAQTRDAYHKDRWDSQPERVYVVSEKATVGGIIRPTLAALGVPFVVYHGFGSASAVKLMADISADDDRPLTLLYVGDHDPSGRYMSDKDLPERLERYGGDATIERVALVASDLAVLRAATFPATDKKKDARYPWFVAHHGNACCELDALDANALRQRLGDAIRRHINAVLWNRAAAVEKVEMASLADFFATWKREVA